jgi:membrane-associated phospholipid phosphatase
MITLQKRTDTLIAVYLIVTAVLAFVFRERLPYASAYVTVHIAGAGVIASLRHLPRRLPRIVQFFRDWYPVILFPVLYKEVEIFAGAFGNWGLTEPIRRLEAALFAGHPSIYLSERLNWVPLSEYLHFCYSSHVLLLPVLGGYWYHKQRIVFRELLFLVSTTLVVSYLFFILFPVDSPFYLSPPLREPLSDRLFYNLVHFISGNGGARGGAFPSTHVSVTSVIWWVAWRRQRKIAYGLTPIALGLIVATVYGRFHYVVDVLAGLALAAGVIGAYWPGSQRLAVRSSSDYTTDPSLNQEQ